MSKLVYLGWMDQWPTARRKARRFDPSLLPEPLDYYRGALHALRVKDDAGWAQARCPFHEDKNPSLSVNLQHGGFYCHGCHESGGGVLDFHIKLNGVPFETAVTELGGWAYDYQ